MCAEKVLADTAVSDKEYIMIVHVLEKYNMKPYKISKSRSAYKVVNSDNQAICLKRMKHGEVKVKNGYMLVNNLSQVNFHNTARYFKTVNDNFYVRYGKYILYVTEWLDGEECLLDNLDEAVNCSKLLADFHLSTRKIDTSCFRLRNNLKNLPKEFYNNLINIEGFRNSIDNKRIKNEFDSLYLRYLDIFYSIGLTALNILNNSCYYLLSKDADMHNTICHDSFYYQNIIKVQNSYFIIDLDSIVKDLQVIDLGKFVRRLMYKNSYQWNFDRAKYIIEAYSSVNTLSIQELEVMLAVIVFPHKFWKLGKKRYIKQKGWSEKKYLSKLHRIIKYTEQQRSFLDQYIKYFSIPE